MKIFLVIVFFNTLNQPMYLDGWHPMEMKSIEQCERAKERAETYINLLLEDRPLEGIIDYKVSCETN